MESIGRGDIAIKGGRGGKNKKYISLWKIGFGKGEERARIAKKRYISLTS